MNYNKRKKVLILGVSGLLGSTVFKFFYKENKFKIIGVSRKSKKFKRNSNLIQIVNKIDDFNVLRNIIKKNKPDYVINCIGVVKSSINKKSILETIYINSLLPKNIAAMTNIFNFKFIHISTDCVFRGDKGNYKEKFHPDANDIYGISKILGECENRSCLTIRTSIIGHSQRDNKGLLEWFLSQKKTIKGYKNAFFSGFTTLELANILHNNIIEKKNFQSGIFHLSSKRISKYDLLQKINKLYQRNIKIIKDEKFKIDRSLESSMFKRKIKYKNKTWDQMLLEMKRFNEQ
tara:strand:- start:151 stop:1020 length:870 start_codon:yes stop_codon:yes gene_type:complete